MYMRELYSKQSFKTLLEGGEKLEGSNISALQFRSKLIKKRYDALKTIFPPNILEEFISLANEEQVVNLLAIWKRTNKSANAAFEYYDQLKKEKYGNANSSST